MLWVGSGGPLQPLRDPEPLTVDPVKDARQGGGHLLREDLTEERGRDGERERGREMGREKGREKGREEG